MRQPPIFNARASHTGKFLVALVLGLSMTLPGLRSAAAESMYVIDRLLVGIHEDSTRESAISKLVPSGTELEVLEKTSNLARVRTADDIEGWVDISYLTDEKPARVKVEELEEWKKTRADELAAAWEEVENLRKLVKTAESDGSNPALDMLKAENQGLKETLAAAEQQISSLAQGQPAAVHPSSSGASILAGGFLTESWHWGVLLGFFLAGMGAGAYLLDYRNRQRHGGFRV